MSQYKDKIQKIKFGVYKCIWNNNYYIVTCDIYVYRYRYYINQYELIKNCLDIYEQICLLLNIPENIYLEKAKEFKARVEYNKYIQKYECLFSSKKDAKNFIKNYLQGMLLLTYINNDIIDVYYIHNYK